MGQTTDVPQEPKGIWMLLLFATLSLFPSAILTWDGFGAMSRCRKALDLCRASCVERFHDDTRVFASEYEKEWTCQAKCEDAYEECLARTYALFVGAGILACSLPCAVSQMCAFESIMRTLGDELTSGTFMPRALYQEPVYTEQEQRDKGKKARSGRFRWRLRSGEDAVPEPVVEVECLECRIPVEVDQRWLTVERSGVDGAVCPRCRNVILGIL